MQCGRVKLQERSRGAKSCAFAPASVGQGHSRPRRYCQKRLINPDHDEDPRWSHVFQRFHCNEFSDTEQTLANTATLQKDGDLFLSVQNLKFQGDDEKESKRPRTSFKYTTLTDRNTHRMFVKQVVPNVEQTDDDRSSQLTCYYYDDYEKYLSPAESRPSSAKSSIFLQGISSNFKENKAIQVNFAKASDVKKPRKAECNAGQFKKSQKKIVSSEENKTDFVVDNEENTKVTYQKSGKRKSLTISRSQSPETVQVIRVDVVCNYSSPTLSEISTKVETQDKVTETVSVKNSHFANKYLLSNTMKTLDENVSGGAKVTLLCKTFRLADRSKMIFKKSNL